MYSEIKRKKIITRYYLINSAISKQYTNSKDKSCELYLKLYNKVVWTK